jgi:hypothetical protein
MAPTSGRCWACRPGQVIDSYQTPDSMRSRIRSEAVRS